MPVPGARLEALFEQQWTATTRRILQPSRGFTYTYSASAPLGARVDAATLRLDGVAIDPAASYRITVNSFLASGGDGFTVLTQGTARLGGAIDLDALEDFLVAAPGPVVPPLTERITALP